jgi:hypothetical protein
MLEGTPLIPFAENIFIGSFAIVGTLHKKSDRDRLPARKQEERRQAIGIVVLIAIFILAIAFSIWLNGLTHPQHPGPQVGAPS